MPLFKPYPHSADLLARQAHWWSTPQGAYLWQQESALAEAWLTRCFGYHAALMGLHTGQPAALSGLRIPHQFTLGPRMAEVLAQTDALPLAAESVDLIMLHHVLEYAADPHRVLREVDRVLVPEGHILLMTFNPLGAWGVRNLFNPARKAPWYGRRLGRKRLHDWLALLGYDIEVEGWAGHGCISRHNQGSAAVLERWGARFWPMLGMTHVMLARKRVSLPAPIRHRWSLMPVLGVPDRAPAQNRMGKIDERKL